MAREDFIKRRQSDPDGLDFDGLREQGIALLQSLSGEEWTDYNLHDPGVTLLEMLVYGLTDLLYRTGFAVPDLLAQESGRIDYQAQALFEPQTILPCAPVTMIDYRKLIYDALPVIDDVWLQAVDDPALPAGLLSIYVKIHESMLDTREAGDMLVVQKVIDLFAAKRNLCQDLHAVTVVKTEPYRLQGEIEIDDSRMPADIYADIYFQCAKLISSGGRMMRYEDALAGGKPWDELLCGPLTGHGYLDDEAFAHTNYYVDVVKLIALVRRIPGVKQVRHLVLFDQTGNAMDNLVCDPQKKLFPALQFPGNVAELQLLQLVTRRTPPADPRGQNQLNYAQKVTLAQDAALLEQVRLMLKKREFEHQAYRRNKTNLLRLLNLPQGERHALQEYDTVSQHAPPIYGINRFGIPQSEPRAVHARARQLKAYLYPFEQIMANYLQSLQDLPRLYSLDTSLRQSYFSQFLSDEAVPDLEILYTPDANGAAVASIQARYDHFAERRHRVLDSLLAMYGESFPTDSLRRFNGYRKADAEQWLIDCKIAYLAHLCDLSANRSVAMNITQPYWQDGGGCSLQHKIALLLGCQHDCTGRSLLAHLHQPPAHGFVSAARYREQLAQVDTASAQPLVLHYRPWFEPQAQLPYKLLCLEVVRAGVDLDNYRFLPAQAGGEEWLCLQVLPDEAAWPLLAVRPGPNRSGSAAGQGQNPGASDALVVRALQLQACLSQFSQQSEGLHVLEHILLRPHDKTHTHTPEPGFYANRVSIILPSITSRFADVAFRGWVEELVAQQLPAHVYPEFYWLDYVYLFDFEQRYKKWLALLAQWNGKQLAGPELTAQLDQAADKLIAFLHKNRPADHNGYWV